MRTYLWTLSFLRRCRGQVIIFIISSIIAAIIELSVPKFIQYVIDTLIPSGNVHRLLDVMGLLAVLFAVMYGVNLVKNLLQRIIAEIATSELQLRIFQQLRRLGYAYFEQHSAGETLSLFQVDVVQVQQIYNRFIPKMVKEFLQLFVAAGFLLALDWKLSLLLLPVSLAYYAVAPYFAKRRGDLGIRVRQENARLVQALHSGISGLLELRNFNAEGWYLSRIDQQIGALNGAELHFNWFASMRTAMKFISVNLGILVCFGVGIVLVKHHQMAVGAFVAYSLYVFRVMNELNSVVEHISDQRLLLVQAKNLYQFLALDPLVSDTGTTRLPHPQGHIEFRGVTFGYPSHPPVIQDLSFVVHPGERVALIGRSGCGKTTIVKLLERFYDINSGAILLDGIPIQDIPVAELRRNIGYVAQENYLFGGTVRENILFGKPDATDAELRSAARAAYADEFIETLPNGYDTIIGERGVKLSGGQKQRIAIARLFIVDPRIIILDEATAALDNLSEREVQSAFDTLMRGRTTLTIAHRLSTVEGYDRIVVIDGGRVTESGTFGELANAGGVFAGFLRGGMVV